MTTAVPMPSSSLPVLAEIVPGARLRDAAAVGGAALLTAVLAQVAIPVAGSPVPITGQTLAVVVTAAALGPARGVAAQLLYLLLGLAGLPFYSDATHGADVVLGATGGYLLAFPLAAWLIGTAARHGQDRQVRRAVPLFIAGQLLIFLVGVPWLAAVADLSVAQALDAGFYPFLIGGLVKALVAGVLLPGLWRGASGNGSCRT